MEKEQKIKLYLVSSAFVLLVITIFGILWLATTPILAVTSGLAFAAGLSMIFLPCTLPLVFVIVPLSMGKGYKKGLGMAFALFGGLILGPVVWYVARKKFSEAI